MPEGRCPNCGALFFGWALTDHKSLNCPNCGTQLVITGGIDHATKGIPHQTDDNQTIDTSTDD